MILVLWGKKIGQDIWASIAGEEERGASDKELGCKNESFAQHCP